ncbi:uncharacterized protein PAC_00047 [Phialocephala subalpina]|uniref:CHAT domain-containing protein n=1 Tax=Phialocephala subalpina TaxID=576137 RepID=A0A1L7WBL7_9HELO|nr:uncharacterized protein PAC_00047 [Phialocephala subalpina]
MPNQKRVSLRLIARQAIDGWAVDVVKDGTIVQRGVPVRDPLSPDQRSTCRWYLEQYVGCLPFSVDRAEEAELLLESYPEDLLRQLSLRDVLAPDFNDAPSNLDSVLLSIEVCHGSDEGGCSVDTIHRLFWELLEDPELWCHPRLAVVVERSVLSPHSDRPSQTDRLDCWKQPDGTLTLNVLVVVARKITQTPSMYDDTSPFLATDALIKVQKMLADTRSPIQIRLEIVRPGTFASFINHLERARTIHGKHGYFHVVHFDMHGEIRTRKGRLNKYGFLSFSDPNSDGTTLVPGHSVGKILEKFEVPFAVLNACESARACLGDDANVAQQFLKHGVRSVLGMSFKITASAAAIFLEAFYHALLVRGGSFSEAAAVGRRVLRMNPMRPARYNRQQRLYDSFVAVTYGPGLDYVLAQSTYSWQRPFMHHTILLPAICNASPPNPATEGLCGRDFDLLKLEKRLLQTHSMYLYGLAGVGKSVFLDRAVSLWKSTNFVDAVVAIDFSKDPILSGEDVPLAMLRQLLSQVNVPKYQSRLWTIPSRSLQSYNNVMVDAIVAEILSEIESIIIFDGLDIPLTPHPSHLAPPLNESSVACLRQLMNSLVALSQSPDNKKPRLVFAARRGDARWLETLIGRQFRPLLGHHPVAGMQPFGPAGRSAAPASAQDRVAALLPWPSPRPLCIGGRPGMSHFFFICLFALYWDEAGSVAALQSIFSRVADASLRQDFHIPGRSELDDQWPLMLLSFALDRGYVRVGDGGACLHIHPLLTIVGRAYLTAFITPTNRETLRIMFCSSLETLHFLFVQQKRGLRIGIANILSSVDFCLTDVPPRNWPLSLFAALSDPTLSSALPLTTRSVLQEQIFQLIKLLSAKFDEVEQKERYMTFFVLSLLGIVSTLENSSQNWERASEVSSIGLRLLPSLDQQSLALNTQIYQSCLLLVQFLSSFPLEDDSGRQRSWQALIPLKDKLCERLSQEGSPFPDLQHLNLLSAGIDGIRSMVRDIQDAQDPNMELSDLRNFVLASALRLIEANKAELLAATTPRTEVCQQRTAISEQQAPELSVDIDIDQFKRMLGFDERNLQSIPMAITKADTNRNKALENSYEAGDWMESLEHHERMFIEASNGYRFKEAEQHIESMRAILTKVSAPRKLFDALDDTKRALQERFKDYLVFCTLYQSASEDGGHTAEDPRPEDALGEPESTDKSQMPRPTCQAVQDMAVAVKECEENPRKWWEWWQRGSSQGSGWIGRLDALCRDGIFADYDLRPSPLQQVRNYFETALCQSQILHDWQAAVASDDFKTAKALLDNLSASVRLNGACLTPSNIEALYVVTDRELLLDFTHQFHAAAKARQLSSCQMLYCGFLELVDKGELSRIKPEEIMVLKSEALGMLMQQTAENKQWKDGISYCNEFLVLCNGLRKCDLKARDSCVQVKLRCEWGLAQEDLMAAETSLDFDKCLELVDVMERLYETQKATPGRGRIATDASVARAGVAKGYRVIVRSQGVGARIITDLSLEHLSDARIIVRGGIVGSCEDSALADGGR